MRNRDLRAKFVARARWWLTFPVVVCALLVSHPTRASDESRANRLFVEAAKLIQAAEEEAVATRKLELLKDAKRKLEAIVDRHPSSRLAVELVSGQKIGTISLPGLVDAIEDAAVLACPQAPNPACLLFLAVVTAGKIEFDFNRDWALVEIAAAQAKVGYVKEALATVERFEDPEVRVFALASIAEVQAENGDVRQAEATLAAALVTAEKTKGAEVRALALAAIARAQAKAGYFEEAFATTGQIEDPETRIRTLVAIAPTQARVGLIREALATVEKLEGTNRVSALVLIAGVQAGNGDVKEGEAILAAALVTAEKTKGAEDLAAALYAITQAEAGYFEEAFAITEKIEYPEIRARLLTAIAWFQAENGDIREAEATLATALVTAEKTKNVEDLASVLSNIAFVQAKASYFEEAFATTRQIEDPETRTWLLTAIALFQAENGDVREVETTLAAALVTAEKIKDAEVPTSALSAIAHAQAKVGYFEEAFATTEQIEDPETRTRALALIAEAQAKNGDIRKAGEIFAIALETTEKIGNRYSRRRALAYIVEAQVKTGSIENAFATANSIRDTDDRARTFARIAVVAAGAN